MPTSTPIIDSWKEGMDEKTAQAIQECIDKVVDSTIEAVNEGLPIEYAFRSLVQIIGEKFRLNNSQATLVAGEIVGITDLKITPTIEALIIVAGLLDF